MIKQSATAYKEHMHELSDKAHNRIRDNVGKEDKLMKKQLSSGQNKHLPRELRANSEDKISNRKRQQKSVNTKKKSERTKARARDFIQKDTPTMKSDNHMIAGMNKGTRKILNPKGSVPGLIHKDWGDGTKFEAGGYRLQQLPNKFTDGVTNHVDTINRKNPAQRALSPFHKITDSGTKTGHIGSQLARHEALEARRIDRIVESGQVAKVGKGGKPQLVGDHFSPAVLAGEMKNTNRMQHRGAAKEIMKIRTNSGERSAIHDMIGKDPYGKGKISKGDIEKAHNSKGTLDMRKTPGGPIIKATKAGDPNRYRNAKSSTEKAGEKIGKKGAELVDKIEGNASKWIGKARKIFRK